MSIRGFLQNFRTLVQLDSEKSRGQTDRHTDRHTDRQTEKIQKLNNPIFWFWANHWVQVNVGPGRITRFK